MSAGAGIRDTWFSRLSRDRGMAACWWRTFYPSLALFIMTAAFIITKTGRDALYFQQGGGLVDLPKAYLGIACLAGPAAMATMGLMKLCGARGARVIAPISMAALQVIFYFLVRPGGGWEMTLLWILIPLLYGVLLSLVWLLGAELLDLAPRFVLARCYSTLGASSMMGGLAGAAIGRSLAPKLEPEAFFLLGAVGLLGSALVCVWGHARFPAIEVKPEKDGPMPAPAEGIYPAWKEMFGLFQHRYLTLLAAVGMTASLVGV